SRDHARYSPVLSATSEQLVRTAQEQPGALDASVIRARLRLLETIALGASDSDLLLLTQRIRRSVEEFLRNGLNFRLGRLRSRFAESYLSQLTGGGSSTPIYELWPSQAAALEEGFLNHRSWVLSLPTSSGKTFLAELRIAAAL